ncbi:MAG: hypothetical protein RL291_163 [Pseudomonadota bacterium]
MVVVENANTCTAPDSFRLTERTSAFKSPILGPKQLWHEIEFWREEKIRYVGHEPVALERIGFCGRAVLGEIGARCVKAQRIVGQFAHCEAASLRSTNGDRDVRLAA